jgi:hypothetical protein
MCAARSSLRRSRLHGGLSRSVRYFEIGADWPLRIQKQNSESLSPTVSPHRSRFPSQIEDMEIIKFQTLTKLGRAKIVLSGVRHGWGIDFRHILSRGRSEVFSGVNICKVLRLPTLVRPRSSSHAPMALTDLLSPMACVLCDLTEVETGGPEGSSRSGMRVISPLQRVFLLRFDGVGPSKQFRNRNLLRFGYIRRSGLTSTCRPPSVSLWCATVPRSQPSSPVESPLPWGRDEVQKQIECEHGGLNSQ